MSISLKNELLNVTNCKKMTELEISSMAKKRVKNMDVNSIDTPSTSQFGNQLVTI